MNFPIIFLLAECTPLYKITSIVILCQDRESSELKMWLSQVASTLPYPSFMQGQRLMGEGFRFCIRQDVRYLANIILIVEVERFRARLHTVPARLLRDYQTVYHV